MLEEEDRRGRTEAHPRDRGARSKLKQDLVNQRTVVASVVIPHGGGARDLEHQFKAVLASVSESRRRRGLTPDAYDVVISCNSTTALAEANSLVQENPSLGPVRVILANTVQGASHARNAGVARADGCFVLFCDSDDEVDHLWVDAMLTGLEEADLVAGHLDFEKLNRYEDMWWRARTSGLGQKFHHLAFGVSANLGLRKALFERIGGFDESMRAGEDVDFCWRAQYAGAELSEVSGAIVSYRLRSSRGAQWRQAFGYGLGDARLLRAHREHGARRSACDSARTIVSSLVILSLALVRPRFRSKARYRVGQLAGRTVGSARYRVWAL